MSKSGKIIFFICLLSLFGTADDNPTPKDCQRVVSLSPSVTEMLYQMKMGDQVVGVTDFCLYPPEAQEKPKVGGYLNPNYEAILRLQPDLVILLDSHREAIQRLKDLGMKTLTLHHNSIQGILDSFYTLDRTCPGDSMGAKIAGELKKHLDSIQARAKNLEHPRVLISIGRQLGVGSIRQLQIMGSDGFLKDILDICGGINAYQGEIAFPFIAQEGLLSLDPDMIIDLIPQERAGNLSKQDLMKDWAVMPNLKAVKNRRVWVLTETSLVIPGPRVGETVQRFFDILHSKELQESP